MWDYAELTSDAKHAGGPDAYRESLYEDGYNDSRGKNLAIGGAIGAAVGALIAWGYNWWRKRRREKREAEEAALRLCNNPQDLFENTNHEDGSEPDA